MLTSCSHCKLRASLRFAARDELPGPLQQLPVVAAAVASGACGALVSAAPGLRLGSQEARQPGTQGQWHPLLVQPPELAELQCQLMDLLQAVQAVPL